MVAEFVNALSPDAKFKMYYTLLDILSGKARQPEHWHRATVTLIPKLAQALREGDFRPITVLSTTLKLAAKMWLIAAEPYICLRRESSHGFRPAFQAAEVHHLLRVLSAKHKEWGVRFVMIKLDISKAYDSLLWRAIDDMLIDRGMPQHLRKAYWKLHAGRSLQFRTGDTSIGFNLTPTNGIPQGSPESPAVYAAVVEGLLSSEMSRRLCYGGSSTRICEGRPAPQWRDVAGTQHRRAASEDVDGCRVGHIHRMRRQAFSEHKSGGPTGEPDHSLGIKHLV